MGISPDAIFDAVASDVKEYSPFGPVGLGEIPPDADYKQFVSTCLLFNLTRKWKEKNTVQADNAALSQFLASNKKCEDWTLPKVNELEYLLLGLFREELYLFFHPGGQMLFDSYEQVLDNSRCGPGSAVGAKGTSFYAKFFSSPLAMTSESLYLVYSAYTARSPRTCEALKISRNILGDPVVVHGSRVSFAPKTRDVSRMICVEPSLNMYFQLGLGALLEGRLRGRFNIDLSTQPAINRRLAYAGSKTGRFATIDLSSASDSISLGLCKEFLPDWVFDTLMEIRSPSTQVGSERVSLNMMSTMGNGFTFPLQTILFSCLVRAVYRFYGIRIGRGRRDWAVFGDDIIVRSECFRLVIRLLELLGFSPNSKKTFSEGPFRESCGADWFYGQPARPVFLKKLDSLQDIMVAINLLNEWTADTGIPLPEGVRCLVEGIRVDIRRLYVPFIENNDSGIRCPSILLDESHNKRRFGSRVYRAFRSVPKVIRVGDGYLKVPRGVKELIYNPAGLELSFLFGELSEYVIPVRHDRVAYSSRECIIPYWDYYTPRDDLFRGRSFWQHWESAVAINLAILRRKTDRA